jgi:predicted dehydrogenase
MSKIKFAIIGQGHIGKRHAEMVKRNPDCELVAVCDIKDAASLDLNTKDVNYYNDAETMIACDSSANGFICG